MDRNTRRAVGAHLFVCMALSSGLPATASALPLISEVMCDAAGSDDGQVFVELYETPGTVLTGLTIEGINGAGGGVTVSIALPGVIPTDGFFVLAGEASGGGTLVANADLLAALDFQNGHTLPEKLAACPLISTPFEALCQGTEHALRHSGLL